MKLNILKLKSFKVVDSCCLFRFCECYSFHAMPPAAFN